MKFKAAIFDLDGTLIDSTWVWYEMMEKFCRDYGLKNEIECMRETVHMPPSEFVDFIIKKYGLKDTVEDIKKSLYSVAFEFYSSKVPLKKGAKNLLELMKKNSINMAIATSCFVELTEVVLKRWGVYDMFSCFLYSEELKTNKKSPYIYLTAAERLGVLYDECGVFEDIAIPLENVKSYGMGYFGVADERREESVKKKLKLYADCYIEDFDLFVNNGSFEKFFDVKGGAD